jgi:hypothetical protein
LVDQAVVPSVPEIADEELTKQNFAQEGVSEKLLMTRNCLRNLLIMTMDLNNKILPT